MSQQIKLIRSNVPGKKPDKFNLNVGELALNTADGLFYFKRGDDTVQTLVSTNAVVEGDVLISGDFYLTGSAQFSGSVLTIGDSSFSGSINVSSSATFRGPINLYPTEAPATGEYSASFYVTSSTNDLWIADQSSSFNFTSITDTLKSGIIAGGVVSTGSSNTVFNVTSGSGQIIDINKDGIYGKPHPTVKYVEWDTFTDQSLTYLSTQPTTWLLIDSDGNLVQQPTTFTDLQYKTHIIIGSVIHPNNTNISVTNTFPVAAYGSAQQFEDFTRIFGPIKIEGHVLSASGSSLSVNRSSGKSFSLGRNYLNNPEQPNIVSDGSREKALFYRYYRSGSGFKTDTNAGAGYDVVDPANYDDGTGILSAIPSGQYTIQRVFYFSGQEDLLGIYYGRDTYDSLSSAEDAIDEEEFSEIENTRSQAILVGYLLVKSSTTDLSNTSDAKFIQAGLFRDSGTSGGGGGGADSLDDLSDVTITSVSTGDLISYTGAGWENVTDLEGNYTITGSLGVTGSISSTGININGTAVTASFSAGNGLTLSGTTFSLNTGSNHFILGTRKQISVTDTTGASGINLDYNQSTGVLSGSLLTSSIYIGAGNGLTGDGSVSLGSSASLAIGAGTGITVNSNDVQLKNAGSLTGNKVLKWDSGNNQLTNSTITDDGTDVSLTGDLTVGGTLTAQEFHTEFVSSSIIYESGSTKFGDTIDDIHERTGSLNISGSINTVGALYVQSNITSSGNISSSAGLFAASIDVTGNADANTFSIDGSTVIDASKNITGSSLDVTGEVEGNSIAIDGTTVIDASRNITGTSLDVTGEVEGNTFSIDGFTVIDASKNITGSSLEVSGSIDGNNYLVKGTSVITSGRAIENITQADIDNIRINGNTISNTATDQNVTIEATGTGILDVNVGSNFQNLITVQNDIYPETNYTSNIGAINKKFLTLNVAELIVETLVASERRSTVGGRFNVGISTQLSQSLASGSTTIIVENNNLNSGDIIHLEGGVLPKVEFMEVTSTGSATSGDGYSYTVTRDLDGSGANDWDAGSGVFNTGQIGNGFIDQYAINSLTSGSGVNTAGPTIAFMERTGSLYPDIDIRAGVGNLKGWYGYTTESFGFAAGDYKGQNITVDPENGLRIRDINTLQFQASGSTLTIGDNFIFDSTSGLLQVSGSNVQLETPTFFLGGTSQFISGSGGNIEISSSNFHLLNGNITASNVDLSGNITATTGNIGGFAITNDAITGSSFYLSGSATGTQFFISASDFNVKANGQLTASAAFIGGTSKIAGFTVSDTQINSGTDLVLKSNGQITGSQVLFTGGKISGSNLEINVENFTALGNSVQISGSNFHLLNGNITASNVDLSGNITATTGNIGGFAITNDAITGSGFYLSGSATGDQFFISASSFNVKANGNLTASNAQISGDITATSGQIAGFTISGDTIVGDAYTIDASATANGEYFISSSQVKIEGNGDAQFGEYTFQSASDAYGFDGLYRESNLTNIRIIQGVDANGNGALLGIGATGDFYIAPVSSSVLSSGSWDGFARELKYSIANDRWEFDTNVYAYNDFEINQILKVNDYARIDALRVGTTNTDPGDGILYVEDQISANDIRVRDDSGANTLMRQDFNVDGSKFFMAPVTASTATMFNKEFGYDFNYETWFVETPFTIGYANGTSSIHTLDVNGTANIGGNLTIAGDVNSTGTISGSTLDSSGDTIVRGNLTVIGDTIITGSVSGHPDITQGSNISVNGSNGVVIQDLTISLDENGHVTTSTAGTVDLDNRYVELAGDSMTGTLSINGTLLKGGSDVSADTGPATVVEQIATATYDAAFFDFVIKKTTNLRAGTVYAIHDGAGNVEFTETSTQDLGDTSDVTLSVDVSGGNIRLLATTTTDGWTVKAFVRGL
jgi:hypothetical protein